MWPAIIAAAGSLASTALSGSISNNISRQNASTDFARQKELMRMSRMYDLEDRNYNTPENIKQRLLDAGLNPDMMYNSGAVGANATPTPSHGTPGSSMAQTVPYDFSQSVSDAVQAVQGIALSKKYGVESVGQQIQNEFDRKTLDERVRGIGVQNKWTEEQTAKIGEEIATMAGQRNMMQAQIDQLRKSNELTDKEISWYDRRMRAEIKSLVSSAEYQDALKSLTDSERELLEKNMENLVSLTGYQSEMLSQSLTLLKRYGDAQAVVGMLGQLISSATDVFSMFRPKKGLQIINNIPKR